jgi:FkbM family methyltransferase
MTLTKNKQYITRGIKFKIFSLLMKLLAIKAPLLLPAQGRYIFRLYFINFICSQIKLKKLVVHIMSGYAKNLKLAIYIGGKSNPKEMDYWLGFYESDIQGLFKKFINKGSIVYDIGAYIGFCSLLAARLTGPHGRVYAFEPLAKNFKRLKLNILLNGMQDRIFWIANAVTDKADTAYWRCCKYDDCTHFMNMDFSQNFHSNGINTSSKETISLDEFVFQKGNPAPNFVKIDVEGEEARVIMGARRLLKEFKPVVICELHYKESALQVYEELTRLGYRFIDLKGNRPPADNFNYGHIIAWHREREFEDPISCYQR